MSRYPLQTYLPPVFQGCYELVTSFMETNMAIIAGVTFGIAFSQVRVEKSPCVAGDVRIIDGTCSVLALRLKNRGIITKNKQDNC